MQKQQVSFELPFLSDVVDYHEFKEKLSFVQSLVGKKTKIGFEELFCEGNYVAVFFDVKNKPSLVDVVELLFENKYTPEILEEVNFGYNNKTPVLSELTTIKEKIKLDKKIKNISTSQPTLKV